MTDVYMVGSVFLVCRFSLKVLGGLGGRFYFIGDVFCKHERSRWVHNKQAFSFVHTYIPFGGIVVMRNGKDKLTVCNF